MSLDVSTSEIDRRAAIAAKVMQGFATTDLYFGTQEKPQNPWPWVAKESVKAADALLAELERTSTRYMRGDL